MPEAITIETTINAPVQTVWEKWTNPDDIVKWNSASDDWHTTKATNDLKVGGRFSSRMEAKDGSMGFDFGGAYSALSAPNHLAYTMDDGRTVKVDFMAEGGATKVVETFDPEAENPVELQKAGWQMILDNFKKYVEA